MSLLVVVVSTVLAATVLVVTRWRLGGDRGTRGGEVDGRVLQVHTVVGGAALALWSVLLVLGGVLGRTGGDVVGIIALAGWWVVAAAGLMLLLRRLTALARRRDADAGSRAVALPVLVHGGMLVCVGVLTWAYATSVA